jgi:pyrroloquinoline quinone biosynthesis protein B
LPQLNCSCPNCVAARTGRIPSRTQSSVAVSGNDREWFLFNASPDLEHQVMSARDLQPGSETIRNSPIKGVLLTNADIDHALGLLLLRPLESPLVVYATNETRSSLTWIDQLLQRFCGIEWRLPTTEFSPLTTDISFRAIALSASVAYELRVDDSGKTVVVAPAVAELTTELQNSINKADVTLFDGTFWCDDELPEFRPEARTAREMHHLPIRDSIDFLSNCSAKRKIYMHINNTNPILTPGSEEASIVAKAGIEIAQDGLEFAL